MKTTLAGLALICVGISTIAKVQAAPTGSLALVGGTIYVDSAAEPLKQGTVLIQDGVIVAVGRKDAVKIPKGVEVIDCSGSTVVAGFWNSHVHFHERKWFDADIVPAEDLRQQLQQMLTQRGFTSVFDTWSNFANTRKLRDRIESGEVPGPRIRTTGEAIMPKGGIPPQSVSSNPFGPAQIAEVSISAEAQAAAIKLLDSGVDGIKLYSMTTPQFRLSEETMAAAATEAHRSGKPVFAHPTLAVGLTNAVRAGADVIVHTTPLTGPWDAATIALMKEKRVALIPTLKLWRYELRNERISRGQRLVDNGAAQVKAWLAAGGTVLFGTDVGYMDQYDTAEEFEYLAKAGMDFRAILASLSTAPAERFGDGQRLGKIAQGYLGDIAVLQGDLENDVRAFSSVRYTLRSGKIIYASSEPQR